MTQVHCTYAKLGSLVVLLSWLLVCASAGDLTVSHRARSLQPGEVVVLTIVSSRPLKQVQAKAFGREFRCFENGTTSKWAALVGIDLDTKPGRYAVAIEAVDLEGKAVGAEYPLNVIAKSFPTRKLTVDDKFVSPPASAQARIQQESTRLNVIFSSVSTRLYWSGAFVVPVPGAPISEFGKRSIYNGQPRSAHTGTDFEAATGTPIKAPNAGKVVLADNLYYTGNSVILDHGLGLFSYFGHMSALSVREGDLVQTGDILGKAGATGMVTGPHLHWSVRLAGARVDPLSLLYVLRPQ